MMSRTHMRVGAAASLAILQPTTLAATIVSVAGGYLGGWICDVDSHNKEEVGDYTDGWGILIPLGIALAFDYLFGIGICRYVISHRSYANLAGLAAFLVLLFIGSRTSHHTFTHSLLAVLLYSVALLLAFPPIVPAFAIGMVTHILVDLLGHKPGVQILFPLSFKPRLNKVKANGKANDVVGYLALAATIVLTVWFVARSIGEASNVPQAVSSAQSTIVALGLNGFQLYLIAINVVAFIVAVVDYFRVLRDVLNERPAGVMDSIHVALVYALSLLGGAIGLFLGEVFSNLYERVRFGPNDFSRDEVYWYVLYLASALSWALVYLTVDRGGADFTRLTSFKPLEHIILLVVFATVNLVTFLAFKASGDGRTKAGKSKVIQFLLLMLCALGGSIGGFLAMAVTGTKQGIEYFKLGVPLLIIPNAVCLVCLILLGVA